MFQPRARVPRRVFDAREALDAIYAAKWEIPLPFIVLGGIYGGYFAISEAAAVTAVYVLLSGTTAIAGDLSPGLSKKRTIRTSSRITTPRY